MNTSAYASPPATAISSASAALLRPERRRLSPSCRRRTIAVPDAASELAASSVADDESRTDRRPPDEPVRAREPQHGEDAAADAVEHARGDAGEIRDQVVRAAQLLVAAGERLGDVHERRDAGQLVAGDAERQPDARVAERLGALVREAVVDAAGDLRRCDCSSSRTARRRRPIGRAPAFRRARGRSRHRAPCAPHRARNPRRAGARSRPRCRRASAGRSSRRSRRA